LGVGQGAREEGEEMSLQPSDGRRVEEVPVVEPEESEPFRTFGGVERQVELRRLRRDLDRREDEPRRFEGRGGRVLEDEEDLEEGSVGEVALGGELGDQLLE